MRIIIFLNFITFFTGLNLYGQNGRISGNVSENGRKLSGVNITIHPGNLSFITNSDGTYFFDQLNEGTYELTVQLAKYTSSYEYVNLSDNDSLIVDFDMSKDNLQLEEMVISGTRRQISKYNNPVIVNTINEKTFEATQSLTVSEGLNFSPGLRLENNCQNCGFTQVRMNGLQGPYSQILINSRPVFSALAGVYGLEMLPSGMIDRVEVVRGGGSVLYGGNAIAGTVNIITKDPMQNSFEAGINQSFTNMKTPDRTVYFNGSIVSDDLDKGITIFGYNRKREPWDANNDGFSEMTQLKNNTFGFDAFVNPSERSKIKLGLYSINEFRRGGDGFELAPHQSNITEQLDHNILSTNLSFEQYSRDYRHKLNIYSSAQFVNRKSYYGAGGRILEDGDILTETDILAINAYGNSKDISAIGGLQYNYNPQENLNLTLGSEYLYNDVIDEMPGYDRIIDQKVGTLGTFAQIEYKPVERFTLLAGGRFDYVRINGFHKLESEEMEETQSLHVLVPRISAMYDLTKNLKARISYAQGYRAPQAFDEDLHVETVGGDVKFIQLGENLETEKSNSYTASLNYSKSKGKRQMNFVAEGFYTRLNNPFILSDQTELPSGVAVITKRNGEAAEVKGINLEANIALGSKVIFQSGATFQTAKYANEEEIWAPENESDTTPPTTTDRILRTPNAYGYFTIMYNPTPKWSLSYSGVITGKMLVPHVIDPDTEYTVIKETPSFFENNIRVAYNLEILEDYKIQFFSGLQNIFNSYQKDFDRGMYRDANYIYGPNRPRTVFMGIKFGLN